MKDYSDVVRNGLAVVFYLVKHSDFHEKGLVLDRLYKMQDAVMNMGKLLFPENYDDATNEPE